MGKTLEGFHAQRRTARDELRAFEQRFGVLLQEMNGKEVPGHDVRLTPENVEELQRLLEEERRLADAYRTAQKDERGAADLRRAWTPRQRAGRCRPRCGMSQA